MPIEVFGAGAVQTAYVSFLALDITDHSLELVWPNSYVNLPYSKDGVFYNVLAASMTVVCGQGNFHSVTIPDATASSVGSNFIITNIGASEFNVLNNEGEILFSLPAEGESNSYWVQLTDNSTRGGIWQYVAFGAGSTSADANTLSGLGLVAIGTTLNTNMAVQSKNLPYTVVAEDRASLIIWTGGSAAITLPAIASVPAGFYVSFNNEGTGVLTLTGPNPPADAKIDNENTLTVSTQQSLFLISDGIQWWTLGFGQPPASSLFVDGAVADPSISFISDDTTGFYYNSAPFIGVTIGATAVANFGPTGLVVQNGKGVAVYDATNVQSSLVRTVSNSAQLIYSNGSTIIRGVSLSGSLAPDKTNFRIGTAFSLIEDATNGKAEIEFNGHEAIEISSTGVVTFPSTLPWTIAQGGTEAATQAQAANNILPTAVIGDILYYNGVDWVALAAGTDGNVLTLAGGVPTWA